MWKKCLVLKIAVSQNSRTQNSIKFVSWATTHLISCLGLIIYRLYIYFFSSLYLGLNMLIYLALSYVIRHVGASGNLSLLTAWSSQILSALWVSNPQCNDLTFTWKSGEEGFCVTDGLIYWPNPDSDSLKYTQYIFLKQLSGLKAAICL